MSKIRDLIVMCQQKEGYLFRSEMDRVRAASAELTEMQVRIDDIPAYEAEITRLRERADKRTDQIIELQARIEWLEAGIRRIVNGEYDNARTIDAAEKFARELLRGDE